MPAVTPADVQITPSFTKIRSLSTWTSGYSFCKRAAARQCVVALSPSNSPAAARINAPEHTLVTRLDRLLLSVGTPSVRARPLLERLLVPRNNEGIRREPILSAAAANPGELFIVPPSSDRTCNRYGFGVTVRVGISKAASGPVRKTNITNPNTALLANMVSAHTITDTGVHWVCFAIRTTALCQCRL